MFQENGSPEEHVLYAWDHFVSKAAARNVFVVAHSYGGLSLVELVSCCFLSSAPPPIPPPAYYLWDSQPMW